MADTGDSDVETIAHAVIMEIAPEEDLFFPAAAARFRAAPDRPPSVGGRDQELGFGVEVHTAVAGLALWLTQEALTCAAALARPALARTTRPLRTRLRGILAQLPVIGRWWRCTPMASAPTTPLDPAALAQVRAVTLDRARAAGIETDTAELLADAIVGRLAVPA